MTPEQRAEQIAVVIEKRIPSSAVEIPGAAMALRVYLAAQIAEAEREAVDKIRESYITQHLAGFREGWDLAKDRAAKMVDEHVKEEMGKEWTRSEIIMARWISKKIRAMQPEGSK